MADLTDATKTYIEQISSVTANLERFNVVTNLLSEVSDSLVHSYEIIAGSKNEHSEKQTVGYVQQMEQLNQSLSGLNEFYSVHLSGLRSQMDTIQQINAGLSRIRDMYDNSVMDSTDIAEFQVPTIPLGGGAHQRVPLRVRNDLGREKRAP